MKLIKKTLSEQAADYIRNLIRSGELRPGDVIREEMLAERLEISRAPIREALLSLGHHGLINIVAQKAKRVRTLTPEEIRDSYAVAGILEGAASALSVAQWTEDDYAGFRDVVEVMDARLARLESPDGLSEIDDLFHRDVYSRCTNSIILDVSKNSSTSIAQFLYFDIWKSLFSIAQFQDRHHRVAEAVMTGDGTVIEQAIREHYEETGGRLADAVARHCGRK
ncbi:MAG: GntR family transcriptional regulator [Mailhella sp.]|nr:GntR family transcriptional regulator [Mailhella sp.]